MKCGIQNSEDRSGQKQKLTKKITLNRDCYESLLLDAVGTGISSVDSMLSWHTSMNYVSKLWTRLCAGFQDNTAKINVYAHGSACGNASLGIPCSLVMTVI